jgi:16S rRNA (guanine527-N7)-methyltransferase
MNLTAIKDRPTAVSRHINDSLAILPAMDNAVANTSNPNRPRIVDVGSGAGLPGLVFATLRPAWSVTLLDSLNKRCTFNTAAAEAMGLTNVDILWSRAEEAGNNPAYREQFDVATARAVAEVRTLAELCLPLIKVGGYWVAPKGPDPESEVQEGVRAVQELGGDVDGLHIERLGSSGRGGPAFTVVTVSKARETPAAYPRKANAIKKRPL